MPADARALPVALARDNLEIGIQGEIKRIATTPLHSNPPLHCLHPHSPSVPHFVSKVARWIAPPPSNPAQSKERKGSNFAVQRSRAIVQKPEGPNTCDLKFWLSPSGSLAARGGHTRAAPPLHKFLVQQDYPLPSKRHYTAHRLL